MRCIRFSVFALLLSCLVSLLNLAPSCRFSIDARRVFLIDPNNFDPATNIMTPTWEQQQQQLDFTTSDADGGVLIFDGAVGENRILQIRNVKAKRIEVNASLSVGSTLLIENCQLLPQNNNKNIPESENDGGLEIAPTIFRSSDGEYSCSKSVPQSSPSPVININIRNNIIKTASQLIQYRGSVNNATLSSSSSTFHGVAIYNLIMCRNARSNPSASLVLNVSGNLFDINTTWIESTITGLAIYPGHRVTGEILETFFSNTTKNNNNTNSIFDMTVPISSINIYQNNFVVTAAESNTISTSVGFMLQSTQWPEQNFFYFNNIPGGLATISMTENAFVLHVTGDATPSIFKMRSLGRDNNKKHGSSSFFSFDFRNQRQIEINWQQAIHGNDALVLDFAQGMDELFNFKTSVTYSGNYQNIRFTRMLSSTANSNADSHLALVMIASVRMDTAVSVSDAAMVLSGSGWSHARAIHFIGDSAGNFEVRNITAQQLDKFRDPVFGGFYASISDTIGSIEIQQNVIVSRFVFITTLFPRYQFLGVSVENTNVFGRLEVSGVASTPRRISSTFNKAIIALFGSNSIFGQLYMTNNGVEFNNPLDSPGLIIDDDVYIGELRISNNSFITKGSHPFVSTGQNSIKGLAIVEIKNNNFSSSPEGEGFINLVHSRLLPGGYAIIENNTVVFTNAKAMCGFFIGCFMVTNQTPPLSSSSSSSPLSSAFLQDRSARVLSSVGNTGDSLAATTTMVIRKNSFRVDGDISSANSRPAVTFLSQTPVSSDPPARWFKLTTLILDGNNVTITNAMTAIFCQIGLMVGLGSPSIDQTQQMNANLELAVINNNVNIVQALTSAGLVAATNLNRIRNVLVNDNNFNASALGFSTLTGFSYSVVDSMNVSSSDAATSSCSFFNGQQLTPEEFRKQITKPTPLGLQGMFGNGTPSYLGEINPGLCGMEISTTSTTQKPQPNATTNNKNETSKTRSPINNDNNGKGKSETQTVAKLEREKPSPLLSHSVSFLSSSSIILISALAAAPPFAVLPIRNRVILAGVNDILSGDCGSPYDPEEIFESPPDLVASPTQMYISGANNGGFATGLMVGNTILIFVISTCWYLGFGVIESVVVPYLKNHRKKKMMMSRKMMEKESSSSRKHKSKAGFVCALNKIFTKTFLAKSKLMLPTVNFCLMFVDPMFNAAVACLVIEEVGVGWKAFGIIICILILVVGFFFILVIYKLLIARDRIEKFHKFKSYETKLAAAKNPAARLWYFLREPEGEWKCPKIGRTVSIGKSNERNSQLRVTRDHVISWKITEPIIDGFTDRFPRFAIVDISVMLGLTTSLIIGHATGNCTAMGILLLIPVAVHLVIVIFNRPDKELLLRMLVPSADALQLIVVALALAQAEEGGSGFIEAIALLLVIAQTLLAVVALTDVVMDCYEVVEDFNLCGDDDDDDGKEEDKKDDRRKRSDLGRSENVKLKNFEKPLSNHRKKYQEYQEYRFPSSRRSSREFDENEFAREHHRERRPSFEQTRNNIIANSSRRNSREYDSPSEFDRHYHHRGNERSSSTNDDSNNNSRRQSTCSSSSSSRRRSSDNYSNSGRREENQHRHLNHSSRNNLSRQQYY